MTGYFNTFPICTVYILVREKIRGCQLFCKIITHGILINSEAEAKSSAAGLFLDNLTTLPYVSELYPLINWSRMLEASLAHRLSRNSAEKTTIDDVIRDEHAPGDVTDSGQSRREDAFAKFKASWQKGQTSG